MTGENTTPGNGAATDTRLPNCGTKLTISNTYKSPTNAVTTLVFGTSGVLLMLLSVRHSNTMLHQ